MIDNSVKKECGNYCTITEELILKRTLISMLESLAGLDIESMIYNRLTHKTIEEYDTLYAKHEKYVRSNVTIANNPCIVDNIKNDGFFAYNHISELQNKLKNNNLKHILKIYEIQRMIEGVFGDGHGRYNGCENYSVLDILLEISQKIDKTATHVIKYDVITQFITNEIDEYIQILEKRILDDADPEKEDISNIIQYLRDYDYDNAKKALIEYEYSLLNKYHEDIKSKNKYEDIAKLKEYGYSDSVKKDKIESVTLKRGKFYPKNSRTPLKISNNDIKEFYELLTVKQPITTLDWMELGAVFDISFKTAQKIALAISEGVFNEYL